MSIIGNMETASRKVVNANSRDDIDLPGLLDDELADDTLWLVSGGLYRREVYVEFCYDDDGQIADVTYIDIG